MSKNTREGGSPPVQATTVLPSNYRRQATLDLSKRRKAVAAVTVCGIVLLVAVGWLLEQYAHLVRPTLSEAIGIRNIVTIAANGNMTVVLPFQLILDAVIALVLVMPIHELVHGLVFWRFAGKPPAFGVKGLGVYTAAPSEIYFPRNQYLAAGIAPLVLLTIVGLLLILIAPVVVMPILIFFVAFNAAGAAGDLMMVAWLLSFSPQTFMQDSGTSVIVYGREKNWRPA